MLIYRIATEDDIGPFNNYTWKLAMWVFKTHCDPTRDFHNLGDHRISTVKKLVQKEWKFAFASKKHMRDNLRWSRVGSFEKRGFFLHELKIRKNETLVFTDGQTLFNPSMVSHRKIIPYSSLMDD